jgi:pimeloyl-ACP methyl ester carboxylesterase
MEPDMDTVNCNGVLLNYRSVGEGENVVLIHGLGANHGFWHLNVLLPLARNYRVIVYDLRGHGYSGMPASGYRPGDMVADLHDLLMQLNIDKTHLIGHSFGGIVASLYTATHPDHVESLTSVDSRLRLLQPTNCPKDWPNWKEAEHQLTKMGLSIPKDEPESGLWLLEQLASSKWQQTRQRPEASPFFIPFSRWGGGNRSAERWLQLLHTTTARQDFISPDGLTIESLSTIQHPTLAICGENSPVIPSVQGLNKYLPNCRTFTVPNAGHFFPLTHSKLFVGVVSRFLEDIEFGDRRKHLRFPVRFPVDLRWAAGNYHPGATLNVSKHGILLTSSKVLEIGSEIEVRTALIQENRRISVTGKVVRFVVDDNGGKHRFGIELFSESEGFLGWENYLTI